ncbi:cytochrome c oxidase subunit 9, mitochondrial [Trichomonascus vanleenenianus]|uniref:cytochrome c oxidase subunit VIIa n=1 Tax=Trichomonascus vanleenenianus TaxID=2268995 RepID=UPI003ECAE619
MPIKPITGTLKRRIIIDITTAFTIGGIAATWWWNTSHKKTIAERDAWYAEYEKTKNAE